MEQIIRNDTEKRFPFLSKLANMSEADLAQIEYSEDVVIPQHIFVDVHFTPLKPSDEIGNLMPAGDKQHSACAVLGLRLLNSLAHCFLSGVPQRNIPFSDLEPDL